MDTDDATRAIQMVDACLRQVAYDTWTNVWDIDGVAIGKTKGTRDIESTIRQIFHDLENEKGKITQEDLVSAIVTKTQWDQWMVTKRVDIMVQNGIFCKPDMKYLRKV